MNFKVKNFYYLIAGVLGILFAVTHAWNGQSAMLPLLHIDAISKSTQTGFTYVWHIITAENLVFGLAFIFMSFQTERSKTRFIAWFIASVLIVRLLVILGITTMLNISGLTDTLIDSIVIVAYVFLIILGTNMKAKHA